jgi:hypothetical protein
MNTPNNCKDTIIQLISQLEDNDEFLIIICKIIINHIKVSE